MAIRFPNELCTCRADCSISRQSTSGWRNQCCGGSSISSHRSFKLIPCVYLFSKITICRTCTTQIFCPRKIDNNPCICCRNVIQSNVIPIITIPFDIKVTRIILAKIHGPRHGYSTHQSMNDYVSSFGRCIGRGFILLGGNGFSPPTVLKHIESFTYRSCSGRSDNTAFFPMCGSSSLNGIFRCAGNIIGK